MGLETGNFINDLVPANPLANDPKSQGDDHIRLMKTVVANCFRGFTGAVFVTGTDGGAANAYTVTPTTAVVSYDNRMQVVFSPTAGNTGASTINISGLGVKNLRAVDGTDLISGDLSSGNVYKAIYNGTEFRLASSTKQYVDTLRAYVNTLAFQSALPLISAATTGMVVTNNGTTGLWRPDSGNDLYSYYNFGGF